MKILILLVGVMATTVVPAQKLRLRVWENETAKTQEFYCSTFKSTGQLHIGGYISCMDVFQLTICGITTTTCSSTHIDVRTKKAMAPNTAEYILTRRRQAPDQKTQSPYERWCKNKQALSQDLSLKQGFSEFVEEEQINAITNFGYNGALPNPVRTIPSIYETGQFYHWSRPGGVANTGLVNKDNCTYFKQNPAPSDYSSPGATIVLVLQPTPSRQARNAVFKIISLANRQGLDSRKGQFVGEGYPYFLLNLRDGRSVALGWMDGNYNLIVPGQLGYPDPTARHAGCFLSRTDDPGSCSECDKSKFKDYPSDKDAISFIPALVGLQAELVSIKYDVDLDKELSRKTKMVSVANKQLVTNQTPAMVTTSVTYMKSEQKSVSHTNSWSGSASVTVGAESGADFFGVLESKATFSSTVTFGGGMDDTVTTTSTEAFTATIAVTVPPYTNIEASGFIEVVDGFKSGYTGQIRLTGNRPLMREDGSVLLIPATGEALNRYAKDNVALKLDVLEVHDDAILVRTTGTIEARFGVRIIVSTECVPKACGDGMPPK